MGKVGRVACIATPGILTIASLICLVLVFLAGTNSGLDDLYFAQVNTTNFKTQVTGELALIPGVQVNSNFLSALNSALSSGKIANTYQIYLRNYCATSANGTSVCSGTQAGFYFNPIEIWGLNGTDSASYVPTALTDGLQVYQKVASWMYAAYTIALWSTVAAIVTGFVAICSRWGSFITALVISVATLFTILSAVTSTVLFSSLVGAADAALKPYNITLDLGTRMMAVDWISVAFSVAAWFFWTISICCCSGKSSSPSYRGRNRDGKRGGAAAAHYDHEMGHGARQQQQSAVQWPGVGFGNQNRGYQPLEGGYGGQQQNGVEMNHLGGAGGADHYGGHAGSAGPFKGRETAYEPFRAQ